MGLKKEIQKENFWAVFLYVVQYNTQLLQDTSEHACVTCVTFQCFCSQIVFFHVKVILVEVGHSFYLVYVFGLCIHTLLPNRESPKGPAPKTVKGTWMGEK